ncbi:MAG TPA: protoporphyrinogen oxidase [Candidatus Binataceae bacterium]
MIVIGAGISGLSAAYRLRELAAARETPLEVTVLERGKRVGGPLRTIRRDGFVIETGSDSFLSEKPWAAELARRIGLDGHLIPTREEFRKTYIVRAGRLAAIPEGFSLLAPARLGPFLRSPLFSPWAKVRGALEQFIPRRREERDESLASFVKRRMGREVLERVAQPLAGGIYTADPEQLSIAATLPRFLEMERRHGSVIKGLRAAERSRVEKTPAMSGARWNLFLSFKNGMSELADSLAGRLAGAIRFGAEAENLARVDRGWRVQLKNGDSLDAEAIICAAPAYSAKDLLRQLDSTLSHLLEGISYASAATVSMAFHETDFPSPPHGFGFVVPIIENRQIIAGSFSSLKFEGRAPRGMILARAFLGGVVQSAMMNLSDTEMIAAARQEFGSLLGVRAAPEIVEVQRWPDAMPQYNVGHLERVLQIEQKVGGIRNLALAGAAYRGVGIPDCVRSGEQAAQRIFTQLISAA